MATAQMNKLEKLYRTKQAYKNENLKNLYFSPLPPMSVKYRLHLKLLKRGYLLLNLSASEKYYKYHGQHTKKK